MWWFGEGLGYPVFYRDAPVAIAIFDGDDRLLVVDGQSSWGGASCSPAPAQPDVAGAGRSGRERHCARGGDARRGVDPDRGELGRRSLVRCERRHW